MGGTITASLGSWWGAEAVGPDIYQAAYDAIDNSEADYQLNPVLQQQSRELVAKSGTLVDDFANPDQWKVLAGALTPETDETHGQGPAIRLTTEDDPAVLIERAFDEPLDITQQNLSMWFRHTTQNTPVVRVRLLAPDRDNQVIISQYTDGHLTEFWRAMEWGPTGEVGDPNLQQIERVQLEISTDATNETPQVEPVVLDDIWSTPNYRTGSAMIIFDDGRASIENAYEEMGKRNMPGAIAVIPWLLNAPSQITREQLDEWTTAGWDAVAHPQVEKPLPAYSPDEQRRLIRRTKSWLVANGFTEGANHIVTPFGIANKQTLSIIADYHATNYVGEGLLSGTPPRDPLTMERVNVDRSEQAKAQIRRAATYNQLVILTVHTVGNPKDDRISTPKFVELLDLIEELELNVTTPTRYWSEVLSGTP
ncbi:polysaccharide deacetylase family protein [Halomarina litorea]|uniref:polysaccharide deacetylase family protein n=1 Tax=Halomarina litorea TaxID=2961595 RepID=UPI0020C55915|nr:polysaccharide deacetylase family protein [Halomarina sp. BCD28]